MELQELQARVAEVLAEVRHPRIGAALALAEETGEVCDLVLKRECYGSSPDAEALAGELADVLMCVAELAEVYGIDLDAACQAKLTDLASRVPGWAESLGPALREARERMDGE